MKSQDSSDSVSKKPSSPPPAVEASETDAGSRTHHNRLQIGQTGKSSWCERWEYCENPLSAEEIERLKEISMTNVKSTHRH